MPLTVGIPATLKVALDKEIAHLGADESAIVTAALSKYLVQAAAAPAKSLAFMFWREGIFVLPLMLFYTAISYRVFRGRLQPSLQKY